jgi:inosine-uridine nucleoside N-ribohydrolase
LGTKAGELGSRLVERYIKAYENYEPPSRQGTAPVHDALAVCAVINPAVIETEHVYVDVETRGELTAGCTVCDVHHCTDHAPNVHVALGADRKLFLEMLYGVLGSGPR